MANRYLSDSNNSFFALEDDVDDETFLRSSTANSSGYTLPNNSYQNRSTYEDKRLQLLERKKQIEENTIKSSERSISLLRDSEQIGLLERKKQIEENTIKSSERSISLLRDSEQIGVATAEELMRQREQLERTEQRLDDINATLRFSQKHIQGIKGLAQGLGEELDSQNDLLESITDKTESTDFKIQQQNKDMKKLLKK
uniref:t-SNARE coiled-coil homology domain-containing protein n=1 Tax=Timema poppense TaxID=170557 RepID=A0A7R9CM33_TIMPO|nr:unnamed protein product [Timema poppensis]